MGGDQFYRGDFLAEEFFNCFGNSEIEKRSHEVPNSR
jgi:hypothetical protein